mmetsp:Transcript_46550/g.120485  ORF Transcript_46550/g.120485 Transcript_46550/m.120485 type:complete len:247 (+) Transcript_46550:1212-1952(+)
MPQMGPPGLPWHARSCSRPPSRVSASEACEPPSGARQGRTWTVWIPGPLGLAAQQHAAPPWPRWPKTGRMRARSGCRMRLPGAQSLRKPQRTSYPLRRPRPPACLSCVASPAGHLAPMLRMAQTVVQAPGHQRPQRPGVSPAREAHARPRGACRVQMSPRQLTPRAAHALPLHAAWTPPLPPMPAVQPGHRAAAVQLRPPRGSRWPAAAYPALPPFPVTALQRAAPGQAALPGLVPAALSRASKRK